VSALGRAVLGVARAGGLAIVAVVGACDEPEDESPQEQALLEKLERIDGRLAALEARLEETSEPANGVARRALTPPTRADPFSPERATPAPTESVQVVLEPNHILLDGKPVTMEALREKLTAAADRQPTLVLRAAKRVPYGRVLEVTGLARSLGYRHIAMATEVPEPLESP